jgi:hypothetical protein
VEIKFSEFYDDMELQISLIDPTLVKTVASPTESVPVKILKFKQASELDTF